MILTVHPYTQYWNQNVSFFISTVFRKNQKPFEKQKLIIQSFFKDCISPWTNFKAASLSFDSNNSLSGSWDSHSSHGTPLSNLHAKPSKVKYIKIIFYSPTKVHIILVLWQPYLIKSWTELSVCHSSLCGLALAILELWYK